MALDYSEDTNFEWVLGIESSCDDTAAAVLHKGKIVSNVVSSQSIHSIHGGVVPELASRHHQSNIVWVVQQALTQAGIVAPQLQGVGYTQGPGLMGALLVGASFAKAFAQALAVPAIGINHMEGHLRSAFLGDTTPGFPLLVLTVSGGHTQLTLMRNEWAMEILGQTFDDAAGEAFDKIGKMLGLPYPAGPILDKLAQSAEPGLLKLPKMKQEGFNFSFSGLKTAVLYQLQQAKEQNPQFVEQHLPKICADVQHTIVGALLTQLQAAAVQNNVQHLAIVGGVSANSLLRQKFVELCQLRNWIPHLPPFQYCTDNAGMIAFTAWQKLRAGAITDIYASPFAS